MNQAKQKEHKKAYHKRYYLAHKKKMDARSKAYQLAHAEEIKVKKKAYQLANKKRIKVRKHNYHKDYYDKNKKQINARIKTYRLAHKKEMANRNKAYRLRNPDKWREYWRKRRASKRGVKHEAYATNYIFERDNWVCQICGRKINRKLKYPNPRSGSIDHIVPLSKGGNDSPINIQATHLRCNLGKYARNKGQLRIFG